MKTTQLIAELMIVGALTTIAGFIVFDVNHSVLGQLDVKLGSVVLTLLLSAVFYVVGFILSVLAEITFSGLRSYIEAKWMRQQGNPSLVLSDLRYAIYVSGPPQVVQRMEYHRSLLRLARCLSLGSFIFGVSATVQLIMDPPLIETIDYSTTISICFILLVFGLIAYCRRVKWFTKTTYLSWEQLQSKAEKPSKNVADQLRSKNVSDEHPKIITFGGGTGLRDIGIALNRHTHALTRIVPVWDNGGSSKELRNAFGIIPPGDIRHALMALAQGEGRVNEVIRVFNWRLSETGQSQEKLRKEFEQFSNEEHPLMQLIEPKLRNIIGLYLRKTMDTAEFRLENASIGNLVLVGAYLTHDHDINAAIYVFKQLCNIQGDVYPVTSQQNLHAGIELDDDKTIITGQDRITTLNRYEYRERIADIFFTTDLTTDCRPHSTISVQAHKCVISAIEEAEIIVFGPGSFFTSTLHHLMVHGIVDKLAASRAKKIFIVNMREGSEGYKYSAEEMVKLFLNRAHQNATEKRSSDKYLSHVIVNDTDSFERRLLLNDQYVQMGDIVNLLSKEDIKVIRGDFEDPWTRGTYDSKLISKHILNTRYG